MLPSIKSEYPLATSTWDEDELSALQSVIEKGRFTMGPQVAAFENEFANYFGAQFAVMVNSGSSANLIALAALILNPAIDLNPGDEVIVPAVSWATTYYPVHQLGLKLKFVDINIDSLNIDVNSIEQAITPQTKAILAVSLLGNPVEFAKISKLCRDNGIVLIEDNCESMGASVDGKFAGTFGIVGTFSSFFSHHISTMEGGMIVTDDRYTYEAMVSLRAHGWTRELSPDNLIYPKSGNSFDDSFRFVLPGYNVRPLEMSGALGRQQLRKLPKIIEGRQGNGLHFVQRFTGDPDVRIQKIHGTSSWFGFSIVLENELAGRREEVVRALTAANIESRPIVAGNFTRNPVMRHLNASVPDRLPAADKIHHDGLFVGNHHYAIPDSIDYLRDTLNRIDR
ncbi:DegT/DnrJ/EryC1/StrS family aminotransferase [Pseudarthrobacter sp. NPDC080039]|uniref:DegT/DnrJ/EryC1/StrS family aminotransferase n=1 Tax=unclassified Pseudarthrobacter TaxID=2647000 RepID=UPI00344B930B